MKKVIRGVGSGLPIVREYLTFSGGSIMIDDNLGTGTVVTIHVDQPSFSTPRPLGPGLSRSARAAADSSSKAGHIACDGVGVSRSFCSVSRELKVGLSTA